MQYKDNRDNKYSNHVMRCLRLNRARLSDLDNWKVQVETASQHFDGLLGGLRGNWYRLEQRFDQIANRLDHKRTPRAIDCSPYQDQVQQVSEPPPLRPAVVRTAMCKALLLKGHTRASASVKYCKV